MQPTRHAGRAVDRRLLSRLVRMLVDLGLYSHFQGQLSAATSLFYQLEGQQLMESADIPHYLRHCEVSENE
jgi:hypothetical protein